METFHVFICVLALIPLCHALCTTVDKDEKIKGCVDKDGNLHNFGSDWTKDCTDCTCTENGLTCCNLFPDDDIPLECELMVNKTDCTFRIVQKSDNTKYCDLN
ncbi:hypothetical protein JOB18_013976 [Solea senegalensis]|uniref:Beta-microseminoprotein n=1 Tax=Solea senegalensis TaxID=28829 RepID=A0AAV6S5F8_SOLSE|nr:beta-microseminoprotein [Solea senegalensis]KAG7511902.1 hypothetical protein JOB18_013976 [Solea senegalensis]